MPPESAPELRAQVAEAVRAHQRAVDAVDEAAADAVGVNRTDLRCLDLLLSEGGRTPGELSAGLGLTTGSVTAMVDRLVRRGLVTRTASPADRRKVVVAATGAAREKAEALYGPIASEGDVVLRNYTPAELATIADFLNRGRRLLETHADRIRTR